MDRQPRIIFWETTRKCNLNCAYCRMPRENAARQNCHCEPAAVGGEAKQSHDAVCSELNTAEVFRVLKDTRDAFGSPIIVLSGGEPLLRNDIFDIIEYASGIGLPVALATNGTLLGEKEARKLKELGIKRVSLSIDSADEVAHDNSRGVKGAFRRTIDAAAFLRMRGVPFQINFTVTRSSAAQIRKVAELAVSLGAAAVHYFVLVPVGCGKELDVTEVLGEAETRTALEDIREVSQLYPIEIRPTCAPQYAMIDPGAGRNGCIAGSGAFFISAEGDIYPCGYLPVKAGSIRTTSVDAIWRDAEVFEALRRNELKGHCGSCSFKDACRGCRARAYSATGDLLSEDPSCAHEEVAVV